MRLWALVVAVVLAIAGCGEPHYAKFSGATGKAYEIERDTCSKTSVAVLAAQVDAPPDISTDAAKLRIAQGVASRYMGPVKRGAYQGCLDGLAKRAR
ncbi:MAG: hypothetical protein M3Z33_05815 [Actinomycetota bacterium]|nr:hypothetical protein [Actinomycetota bacterium]